MNCIEWVDPDYIMFPMETTKEPEFQGTHITISTSDIYTENIQKWYEKNYEFLSGKWNAVVSDYRFNTIKNEDVIYSKNIERSEFPPICGEHRSVIIDDFKSKAGCNLDRLYQELYEVQKKIWDDLYQECKTKEEENMTEEEFKSCEVFMIIFRDNSNVRWTHDPADVVKVMQEHNSPARVYRLPDMQEVTDAQIKLYFDEE